MMVKMSSVRSKNNLGINSISSIRYDLKMRVAFNGVVAAIRKVAVVLIFLAYTRSFGSLFSAFYVQFNFTLL